MHQVADIRHRFRNSEPKSSISKIIKAKNAIKKSPFSGLGRKCARHPVSLVGQKETSKKSVSFAPFEDILHTLSLDDYTDEEHGASFYYDDDYEDMASECSKTIQMMLDGKTITNSSKYCTRGLERATPYAEDERELLKAEAYIAVLEEQENQNENGKHDLEKICRKYREAASNVASVYAHTVGLRDELYLS